ncbi:MAG TPA: CoA transferase, partial [Solirubrobacterales bacterium]|nr:CoA transferase [Solirubrobacterales bacterium]
EARRRHREEMTEEIEQRLRARDMADWQERLNVAGVPAGPILNVQQAFEDPQASQLPIVREVESPKLGRLRLSGHGVNLERTPPSIRSAAPERGAHTDEILRGLGFSDTEIRALRTQGAV